MRFEKIILFISTPRIGRYLQATGNSKSKATLLYKANLKISQAFLPTIAILEVTLRNRINTILTAHFSDSEWIINQKNGFMIDPNLTHIDKRTSKHITNRYLKTEVEKAEKRIQKSGAVVTSGKIISEQTFGFWTDLYEVHHYKILLGRPIQIFTNLPSGHGRKEVNETLNKIRLFRNRLYHNEPICFNGGTINFQNSEDVHNSILNVLSWIDCDLVKWIKNIDEVGKQINRAKNI
jgi:hypothetical protein